MQDAVLAAELSGAFGISAKTPGSALWQRGGQVRPR